MSEDDLKGFIEDVIKDMVSDGTIEGGEDFEEIDDVEVEDSVDVDVEIDEMAHGDKDKDKMEERKRMDKGEKGPGLDVMKGRVTNMKSSDIIEPLAVKNQIVSAATEAACMIIRIDDVIATAKSAGPPPGAEGGMPPGMGGMGMPPGMGGMGGMPDMGGMM